MGAHPDADRTPDGAASRRCSTSRSSSPILSSPNPSISPDGTRIAYLAPHRGRRNVWVRGIDQSHDDAVPVTHDTRRGITTYYWTDDPRWLLYLQDTDGNEDWHLYRVDLDDPDAPAVDLTPIGPGSRVFAVDAETTVPGTVIAWMNPRPLYIDVFRIDLATGETHPARRADRPDRVLPPRPDRPTGLVPVARTPTAPTRSSRSTPTPASSVCCTASAARSTRWGCSCSRSPTAAAPCSVDYQDCDDLRLVRLDRETGERTVIAAVDGHSLDTLSAAADTLPPTVFTSRRTGEVLAARFTGDRPHHRAARPATSPRYRPPWRSCPTACSAGCTRI